MDRSNVTPSPISGGRILYFDYLRIIAIYTTVAIHVISQVRYMVDVHDFNWKVFNIFLSAFRWGVPVFTMISGALFLNPDRPVDIKTLYSKNISKLLLGFCFWSVAYAVIFDIRGKSIEKFLYSVFTGDFHMWFLFMITVMYMLVPLLRKFTCEKNLTHYFLKISFILSFVIPQILFILQLLPIPYFQNMVTGIQDSVLDMVDFFPHYYLFYFVGGYYLSTTELDSRKRKWLYSLGVLAYLFTVIATWMHSDFLNTNNDAFQNHNGVNIAVMSAAVFIFGKYELSKIKLNDWMLKLIFTLSGYSIGIYYCHLMIIKATYGILDLSERGIHPLITCLVFPPIAFIMSVIATAVMRKIPLLKKVV